MCRETSNNSLYGGTSTTSLIYNVLLRFRAFKIALTADIEKALLNISVVPVDRDYLRFPWVDNVNLETPQLRVYRFARLVFGLCSSPFLLNAIITHHITNHLVASQFAEDILRSLYVGDYVGGADSEEAVLERQRLLKSTEMVNKF